MKCADLYKKVLFGNPVVQSCVGGEGQFPKNCLCLKLNEMCISVQKSHISNPNPIGCGCDLGWGKVPKNIC